VRLSKTTKELILHNPLIKRYRYSLLRPSQFWIYLTIYTAVIGLLLFVNYSVRKIADDSVIDEGFYRNLYNQFLTVQVAILWIWAAINSRSAIRDEVSNKTYDFFRLLPLSALQKTSGILFGRNLLSLLFAAVTFVPIILFGLLGDLSVSFQVQVVLALLSIALFVNSLALLSSNTAPRRQGKTSIVLWVFFLIFIGPYFMFASFGAISQIFKAEECFVGFYSIELPVLLLITFIFLYFGCWNILGIVRKFTFETEPLFNRKAAFLFLLGYELIAIGLFLPHLSDKETPVYLFWLVSLMPVILVPIGSLRNFDSYLECCGLLRLNSDSPKKGMTSTLLLHSNLALAIGLFAVWVIFSALMSLISHVGSSQFVFNAVVIFSFYLFLLLLLELYVVYNPIYNKIGLLLGFITILYLFLPIILSFALEIDPLRFYSPFGFFAHIFDPSENQDFPIRTSILIVNILLCIVPTLLIRKRYLHILTLRQEM